MHACWGLPGPASMGVDTQRHIALHKHTHADHQAQPRGPARRTAPITALLCLLSAEGLCAPGPKLCREEEAKLGAVPQGWISFRGSLTRCG